MSEHTEWKLPFVGTTVRGDPSLVADLVEIDRRMASEEREWVVALRAEGIKAAHPDDGWVDRDRSEVYLCYPQFNDGLAVGDRLALGRPGRTRIVTVVGRRSLTLDPSMTYWKFEEMPAPRQPSIIRHLFANRVRS